VPTRYRRYWKLQTGILSRSYRRSLHHAPRRHAVCRRHVGRLFLLSHTVTASVRL
jgi:hypothetical protein